MSAAVFYERAVALDRSTHRETRIQIQPDHYAFARETNALPISASEFADAGRHYPIVFVGDAPGSFHVAVLLGLEDKSNLFVTDQGTWAAECYVPAFARRYPFVLGTTNDESRLAVCIDESYPGLNQQDGVALFDGDKETPYLAQMMEFLRAFQDEMEVTKKMANRLHELGLIVSKSITISQGGRDHYLSGFWVVDDQKLAGLDDQRVVELFRSGLLRLIELHRASLGNVQRLAARLDERRRQQEQSRKDIESSTDVAPKDPSPA